MLYNTEIMHNQYINPGLYTQDDVLARYPKTQLVIGSCDPFKDDVFRFTSKLLKAGAKDVELIEIRMLSHGYLS